MEKVVLENGVCERRQAPDVVIVELFRPIPPLRAVCQAVTALSQLAGHSCSALCTVFGASATHIPLPKPEPMG